MDSYGVPGGGVVRTAPGDFGDLMSVLACLGAVRGGELPPALVDRAAWWLLRLHPRRRRLWRRVLERRLWAALPARNFLGEHTPRLRGRIWAIGWRRGEGENIWHLWVR